MLLFTTFITIVSFLFGVDSLCSNSEGTPYYFVNISFYPLANGAFDFTGTCKSDNTSIFKHHDYSYYIYYTTKWILDNDTDNSDFIASCNFIALSSCTPSASRWVFLLEQDIDSGLFFGSSSKFYNSTCTTTPLTICISGRVGTYANEINGEYNYSGCNEGNPYYTKSTNSSILLNWDITQLRWLINYDVESVNFIAFSNHSTISDSNHDWYIYDSSGIYAHDTSISATEYFCPTPSPTVSPTVSPTKSPSPSPIMFPTFSPTLSPLKLPSPSPTLSPVRAPSSSPISSPTFYPTLPPIPQNDTSIVKNDNPKNKTLLLLYGIVGGFLGLAILCCILWLCFSWSKYRKNQKVEQNNSLAVSQEMHKLETGSKASNNNTNTNANKTNETNETNETNPTNINNESTTQHKGELSTLEEANITKVALKVSNNNSNNMSQVNSQSPSLISSNQGNKSNSNEDDESRDIMLNSILNTNDGQDNALNVLAGENQNSIHETPGDIKDINVNLNIEEGE